MNKVTSKQIKVCLAVEFNSKLHTRKVGGMLQLSVSKESRLGHQTPLHKAAHTFCKTNTLENKIALS